MPVLPITSFWDGPPLPLQSRSTVRLTRSAPGADVTLVVEAPLHGDPPPPYPPGPVERLWEHEVVELFLLGDDGRYLEVELGPGGHHLVLSLHGTRHVVHSGLPLDYAVQPLPERRFRGVARVPARYLPEGRLSVNAYAIHAGGCGRDGGRCHHAHAPVPGPAPDFHQLERFVPLPADAWP